MRDNLHSLFRCEPCSDLIPWALGTLAACVAQVWYQHQQHQNPYWSAEASFSSGFRNQELISQSLPLVCEPTRRGLTPGSPWAFSLAYRHSVQSVSERAEGCESAGGLVSVEWSKQARTDVCYQTGSAPSKGSYGKSRGENMSVTTCTASSKLNSATQSQWVSNSFSDFD